MCEGWDDHDFDDNWIELIENALKDPVKQKSRFELLKEKDPP
jgi:phosphodiesterase/alkaline phosphatase D-like protein